MTLLSFKLTYRAFAIILLSLALPAAHNYAQTRPKKEIILREKDYILERQFEYTVDKNDTLPEGRYTLTYTPLFNDKLVTKKYAFKRQIVNLKRNKKEGDFVAESFDLIPDFSGIFPYESYIHIPYHGVLYKNSGTYSNNLPSGTWRFSKILLKEGQYSDSVLVASAQFGQEGMLKGSYRWADKNKHEEITGEFNEGFVNGLWHYKKTVDEGIDCRYYFLRGKLSSLQLKLSGSSDDVVVSFQDDENNFETLPLDSLFGTYLNLALTNRISGASTAPVAEVFNTIVGSLNYLSLEYSNLSAYTPGGVKFAYPWVQLPVYDLSAKDKKTIERINAKVTELANEVNEYLSNAYQKNFKPTNADIASLYARLKIVNNVAVKALEITGVLQSRVMKHMDVHAYIENSFTDLHELQRTTITLNGKTIEEKVDVQVSSEDKNSLQKFLAYLEGVSRIYQELTEETGTHTASIRSSETLAENEARLIELSRMIKTIADTVFLPLYSLELEEQFKRTFVDFTDRKLRGYQALNMADRIAAIDTTISCFENLVQYFIKSAKLVDKKRLVDEAYMERRLNPYTYTEMNVRINEKLFRAYSEKIIPYLIHAMAQVSDCGSFFQRIDNIGVVQDFMMKAKKEHQTRKLERQFKLNDAPEVIVRKLNIPVTI